MSELCNLTTTPHDSKFHTLLDIFFFSSLSFILSHPLYFSYFIFFSPYLVKLLSFLSPLFLTTFLSLFLHDISISTPKHNSGFLLSTFLKISEKLDPKIAQEDDQEMPNFEDFQVYKILFDHHATTFDHHIIKEIPTEVSSDCVTKFCTHEDEVSSVKVEERKLGNFLELLEKVENMEKEKKVVDHDKPPCLLKSNKVDGEKQDIVTGSEVKSTADPKKNGGNVNYVDNHEKYNFNNNLDSSRSFCSSYGLMRREKEWTRTLACKLFEERHNAGKEDGMDSLWETYEKDFKKDSKTMKANVTKKTGELYYDFDNNENDEEEDEEELISGKICCLQALKMSTGKMNFGMGKNNFVKISKALKGIGWLHKVSRNGKKR